MAENKVEVVFGAQVAGLIAGVKQVKDEIEGLRSPVDDLVKNIKGIAEATGIAFAFDKLKEWTEHVAEAAENLVNLSETFGTTTDKLKEFQNIMALAGGEGNSVTRAMIGLARAVDAADNPLSKQRVGFERIGVSMQQLRERAEDPLALLDLLRQRFSALEPNFQRTEAFTQALGFRFYQLVPILKLTDEEYAKFHAEQAKTGANDAGIKELEELGYKINAFKLAIEGFGKAFILNIVDPLKAGVEWITHFIESITKAIDLTGTLKPIPEGGASAAIPPRGATPEETEDLARIRQKESGNRYDILHGPGGRASGTITDFSQFPQWAGFQGPKGKSHAAGAYGFQPDTYAAAAKLTGLSDFSPQSQDANALAWRRAHPEAWDASMGSDRGPGEGGKEKTGPNRDAAGEYKSTMAGFDLEQKRNKENYEQWLALEAEKLGKIAEVYKTDSEEYKNELAKQLEYTRQHASEELAIQMGYFGAAQAQAKASFENEKRQGEQAVTLGKDTRAKMLSNLIAELDNEHSEEDKMLLSIRDNYATTEKERQKLNDQLIKMDAQYQAQRGQLEAQYTAEVTKEQAKQLKIVTDGFDTLGKSLTSAFNGLLTGQTTWAAAAKKIYQDVGNFFLTTIEEMGAKWAASGLASAFGGAVQTAVKGAQSTGGTGLGAGLAALIGPLIGLTTTATSQTAATLANTIALTANTAALAASSVSVGAGGILSDLALAKAIIPLSKGGIISAAGGWALPSLGAGGTLANLHSNEMVLPANISQGLQGAINGGTFGGGGHTFNLNVSAMDGASVMKHGPAIVASINSALRNGASLRSNGSY